jgi:hypothetical protein
LSKETPSSLTDQNLTWDQVPGGATIGFYVGSAQSFDDLVNFWNLRTSGVNVVFLDPDHADRLALLRDNFTEHIAQVQSRVRETDRTIAVWSQSQDAAMRLKFAHDLVPYFNQVEGLNILSGNRLPPLHYIAERRLLGAQSEHFGKPTITFQLPEKPFPIEDPLDLNDQHFVVSISRITTMSDNPHTFWTPFLPEMNRWIGRQLRMDSKEVRAELDGFGIICPITEDHLQVYAIQKLELTKRLFEIAGISAQSSHPGRIATRLISQLGGLQGCRVLKIAGGRLIKENGALQEFGWAKAIGTIASGTEEAPQPSFSEYEDLSIETRSMVSKLTPVDVFHYLLSKGVFRPGLTLKCPRCELAFWVQLDDVSTQVECAYCGTDLIQRGPNAHPRDAQQNSTKGTTALLPSTRPESLPSQWRSPRVGASVRSCYGPHTKRASRQQPNLHLACILQIRDPMGGEPEFRTSRHLCERSRLSLFRSSLLFLGGPQ